MKKSLAILLLVFGFATVSNAGTKLVWFHSRGNVFSVQAPSNWIHDKTSQYLSIYSPDGRVTLNARAYKKKKGSSFLTFTIDTFRSVQKYYMPVGEMHKIKHGMLREYEGGYPGETRTSFYLVAAIDRKNYYLQITILTDGKTFKLNKKLFMKMLETVKVNHKK